MTKTSVVEDFMRALETSDFTALRRIYASDAKIWHNDGAGEQSVDENLRALKSLFGPITDLSYDIQRRYEVPDGVIQTHVLRGNLPNGEVMALDAVMYFRVEGETITRIEEYFDVNTVEHLFDVTAHSASQPQP